MIKIHVLENSRKYFRGSTGSGAAQTKDRRKAHQKHSIVAKQPQRVQSLSGHSFIFKLLLYFDLALWRPVFSLLIGQNLGSLPKNTVLYGNPKFYSSPTAQESSIKVNLAGENDKAETQKKELPVWLAESTVINSNYSNNSNDSFTGPDITRTETPVNALKDDYISQLIQVFIFFGEFCNHVDCQFAFNSATISNYS